MKATGIVRRIDDLGRVVIPKEIRSRTMRIREGDPLEIYTTRDGEVIFKKYSLIGGLEEFAAQFCDTLSRSTDFSAAVTDRDAVIAMENPTYRQAYRVLSGVGHKVLPVGIDKNGFCVKELEGQDVQAAYVMPSHQFPTGIVMPVKRRQGLLSWAGELPGRYLIEDDYDSEFRYQGKPIPAMQGLDDGENVIYTGTFSKAIAPAIRVCYMVLPQKLVKQYQKIGRTFSCAVSRIDQKVLTMFLTEGHFERHLNRMRNIYKEKHDQLIISLKKLDSKIKIYGHGAGAHIIVSFPVNDPYKFQKELKQRGVMIYPLSWYYIEGKPSTEEYILGFTRMKKEDMIRGIEIIREVLYSK